MIVDMKQVYLLCMEEHSEEALNRLADLGVVHITAESAENSEEISINRSDLEEARRALALLNEAKSNKTDSGSLLLTSAKAETGAEIVTRVQNIVARTKDLNSRLVACKAEHSAIEPFGNFEPEKILELEAKGMFIRLLSAGVKDEVAIEGVSLFPVSESSGRRYILAVAKQSFDAEALQEHPIPERSMGAVLLEIESCKSEIDAAGAEMTALSREAAVTERHIKELEEHLMFSEARAATSREGEIAYLKGFCPAESADALREAAKECGWGLVVDDPSPEDNVPTLIRSPGWIRPIRSLFTLLDIVPGYKEAEIRPAFLIFFSVFFGILVNDAGYGLIFLLLTIGLRLKFKKAPADPFKLFGLLSVCAIIWGMLTGSYFGILSLPAPMKAISLTWFHDEKNFMSFAFLLGAIHLTVAHAWRAVRMINSTRAIAQVGWICVIWSAFFLARMLILGMTLPDWFQWLCVGGISLVVLFMTPMRKLKTDWADHIMLPFDFIGGFADLVSYVRLFAVASASMAVAEAFNELATHNGIHSWHAGLVALIILTLGHGLNIILALMSILVHGVRLNTLEFSSHMGMEWAGRPYEPFSKSWSADEEELQAVKTTGRTTKQGETTCSLNP